MTISSGLFKSIGEKPSTLVCPAFDELPGCCFPPPPSGKSLTFVPPLDGAPGIVGFDGLETLAAEEEGVDDVDGDVDGDAEYDAPDGPGPVNISDFEVLIIASSSVEPKNPCVSFE